MVNEQKKVLITGGNGFIGAHLGSKLLDSGHIVHLLDLHKEISGTALSLNLQTKPGCTYFQGDVSSPLTFSSLDHDYTHIVHAAAILGIKKVCDEGLLTLRVNITGTENCLCFSSRQAQLERFLSFSTSEIYGRLSVDSRETDDAAIPSEGHRWCYAASKLAAEQLTKAYGREFDIPFTIVRPFNVYGSGRLGDNAFSTLVKSAYAGETIVLSGNGSQSRAWCHISDIVDGLMSCLFSSESEGEIFNLGNPDECMSMLQLANLICSIMNRDVPIHLSGSVEPDVETRSPNITKARTMLGFNPKVSLREGIERFISSLSKTDS